MLKSDLAKALGRFPGNNVPAKTQSNVYLKRNVNQFLSLHVRLMDKDGPEAPNGLKVKCILLFHIQAMRKMWFLLYPLII